MSGLGHYMRAEELLAEAEESPGSSHGPDPRVAQAQVHAIVK
jgi:hypothetical protein